MLTNNDFKDIQESRAIIAHIKDGSPSRLSFDKILTIIEFILISAKTIMFRKNGTPKNTIELVGSIVQIIGFIRELVRMITGEVTKKPVGRIRAKSNEIKTVEAIEKAVKKAKD